MNLGLCRGAELKPAFVPDRDAVGIVGIGKDHNLGGGLAIFGKRELDRVLVFVAVFDRGCVCGRSANGFSFNGGELAGGCRPIEDEAAFCSSSPTTERPHARSHDSDERCGDQHPAVGSEDDEQGCEEKVGIGDGHKQPREAFRCGDRFSNLGYGCRPRARGRPLKKSSNIAQGHGLGMLAGLEQQRGLGLFEVANVGAGQDFGGKEHRGREPCVELWDHVFSKRGEDFVAQRGRQVRGFGGSNGAIAKRDDHHEPAFGARILGGPSIGHRATECRE